ncbi:DUF488 domain-containing protein [Sciscionella sediminilitoris]|uniref:DUF488 domain-containing protein n=1 Tax=Sciscionella sediminilitoris TaxID=1445613 RepID=UPI0004DF2AF3|nr:DUF488 family protein [Sciscionella sp. SE31]
MARPTIRIRRVYAAEEPDEGLRVLIDRLWPRGVRRETLAMDEWAKELAPSSELRTWYGHRPERFAEFRERYRAELSGNPAVHRLAHTAGTVTLLTATKDLEHSHAVVLAELLGED